MSSEWLHSKGYTITQWPKKVNSIGRSFGILLFQFEAWSHWEAWATSPCVFQGGIRHNRGWNTDCDLSWCFNKPSLVPYLCGMSTRKWEWCPWWHLKQLVKILTEIPSDKALSWVLPVYFTVHNWYKSLWEVNPIFQVITPEFTIYCLNQNILPHTYTVAQPWGFKPHSSHETKSATDLLRCTNCQLSKDRDSRLPN